MFYAILLILITYLPTRPIFPDFTRIFTYNTRLRILVFLVRFLALVILVSEAHVVTTGNYVNFRSLNIAHRMSIPNFDLDCGCYIGNGKLTTHLIITSSLACYSNI